MSKDKNNINIKPLFRNCLIIVCLVILITSFWSACNRIIEPVSKRNRKKAQGLRNALNIAIARAREIFYKNKRSLDARRLELLKKSVSDPLKNMNGNSYARNDVDGGRKAIKHANNLILDINNDIGERAKVAAEKEREREEARQRQKQNWEKNRLRLAAVEKARADARAASAAKAADAKARAAAEAAEAVAKAADAKAQAAAMAKAKAAAAAAKAAAAKAKAAAVAAKVAAAAAAAREKDLEDARLNDIDNWERSKQNFLSTNVRNNNCVLQYGKVDYGLFSFVKYDDDDSHIEGGNHITSDCGFYGCDVGLLNESGVDFEKGRNSAKRLGYATYNGPEAFYFTGGSGAVRYGDEVTLTSASVNSGLKQSYTLSNPNATDSYEKKEIKYNDIVQLDPDLKILILATPDSKSTKYCNSTGAGAGSLKLNNVINLN